MRINTVVQTQDQVETCSRSPYINEVLIESEQLCTRGILTTHTAQELAASAVENGLDPVLVWDLLMTEDELEACIGTVREVDWKRFSAVRVTDPGALQWVIESGIPVDVHLNCDNALKNLKAIEAWSRFPSVRRLVLSVELSESAVCQYCRTIPLEFEYPGACAVEVFYSRRRLLSPHISGTAELRSKDLSLRAVENSHGTFLYTDTDHFILNRIRNLNDAGLHTLRIDMREYEWSPGPDVYADAMFKGTQMPAWPGPTGAMFFEGNTTDSGFRNLKSTRALSRFQDVQAEVIAAEKDLFVAFEVKKRLESGCEYVSASSAGDETWRGRLSFRDCSGTTTECAERGEVVFSEWIPATQAGSILLREEI